VVAGGNGRLEVTPLGPVEANRGVRAHVRVAGKALEGVDRQTDDSFTIERLLLLLLLFFYFF